MSTSQFCGLLWVLKQPYFSLNVEKLGDSSSLFQVKDLITAKYSTTELFQNLTRPFGYHLDEPIFTEV